MTLDKYAARVGAALTVCGIVFVVAGAYAFSSTKPTSLPMVVSVHHVAGWGFLLLGGSFAIVGLTLGLSVPVTRIPREPEVPKSPPSAHPRV